MNIWINISKSPVHIIAFKRLDSKTIVIELEHIKVATTTISLLLQLFQLTVNAVPTYDVTLKAADGELGQTYHFIGIRILGLRWCKGQGHGLKKLINVVSIESACLYLITVLVEKEVFGS